MHIFLTLMCMCILSLSALGLAGLNGSKPSQTIHVICSWQEFSPLASPPGKRQAYTWPSRSSGPFHYCSSIQFLVGT